MKTSVAELAPDGGSPSLFARIALSLSGGGFRAAAYSLGTLNALYLLGLLDKVHMLSSASGGTLMGAFYALRRKQGASFEDIYQEAYAWLEQDTILPGAIENWHQAVSSRRADVKLIRAFANVYDQQLYRQQSFGIFWGGQGSAAAPFHLQSIIFGATELYSGLTFRFQYAAFLPQTFTVTDKYGARKLSSYYIGNGNVYLSHADAQRLRLADIVAASSCFPVGFEPLVLPDDFELPAGPQLTLCSRDAAPAPAKLAVIDGGVYDNQGIESLLLANKRNRDYRASKEFATAELSPEQRALLQPSTLFVVADVGSAATGLYDATKPVFEVDKGASLRRLLGYAWWGALGLLGAGGLLAYFGQTQGSFLVGVLVTLGVLGALLLLLGRWAWQQLTARLRQLDEGLYQQAAPVLLRLTPAQWAKLLLVRIRTAAVLLLSVFTRRVRSQTYGLLYNQDDPATQAPVVASIIGGLLRDYPHLGPGHWPDELAHVLETVQTASQMGTTLWWGQNRHRLPAIVASAAITLCYRLLRRFEAKDHPPLTSCEREVQRRAQVLWQAYVASKGSLVVEPGRREELLDSVHTAA